MPNLDQRKLIERLNLDKNVELMPHELNELLEQELSKPAEEVDARLVSDLLDLLNADKASDAQREACWQEIETKVQKKKRHGYAVVLRRIAAAAAAVIVLFFVSFETAKAFRWTFLLKLLAPVAETFGIYSSNVFENQHTAQNDAMLSEDDTGYEQLSFASIDDMPAEVDGYRVTPAWVPERFAFLQGSVYEDPEMANISTSYIDEDDILSLNTWVFHTDDVIFNYSFERTLEEPITDIIEGIEVTYYHNSGDKHLSASWIDETAHYYVFGNVTPEELDHFIRSMLGTE